MKENLILLVTPCPGRDLEGVSLVAYHLQKIFGHRVELCEVDRIEERLLEGCPDIILFDFLGWDTRAKQAALARSLQIKVGLLPVAGNYEGEEEFAREAGKLTDAAHLVQLYLSWGRFGRDTVVRQGLIHRDRARITGCPRFDLYCKPYLSLLPSRHDFLMSIGSNYPEKPMLLWTTNTPHFARTDNRVLKHRMAHSKCSQLEIENDVEDERTQFVEQSRVIRRLAEMHPEWQFIIKVHPLESTAPYLPLQQSLKNVYVVQRGAIRDFLFHAALVLQRGCTTATEAWMLDKPVLNLRMGTYHREWTHPAFQKGNHSVFTFDEAEEAGRFYLAGGTITQEQQRARNEFIDLFYYRIDGQASHRCAQHIDSLLQSRTEADRARTKMLATELTSVRSRRENDRFVNRLKDTLKVNRDTSLRFWRRKHKSDRTIESAQVAELHHRFDALAEPRPDLNAHPQSWGERTLLSK